jgi:hypothetical protein
MSDDVELCVFCGRPIPEPRWREPTNRPVVKHLYCSPRCARRQQETIRRLRETSVPEALRD